MERSAERLESRLVSFPPLESLIARGGSAEVWRSGDLAVKVLTTERAQDAWYRISFQREVRAAARLDHPNLLEVIDYGIDDRGRPWLASPFMRGGDLLQWCGRMDWPRVRGVLLGLLHGLAHAHARGIIHLDVKPRNVLSGQGEWKLGDFGLAHALEWDHDPSARIVGTPAYMAPEHFDGAQERYGPWTDLYSLGCLAWQLVTGAPPFVGGVRVLQQAHGFWPLPELRPTVEVPAGLEAWLARLLEKEPAARFRHAADAAYGLSRLSEERTRPALVLSGPLPADVDTLDLITDVLDVSGPLPIDTGPLPVLGADATPFAEDWRSQTGPRLLDPRRLGLAALRTVPLVGRDPERDVLWGLLRDLEGVEVVCVSGPPGIGKTTLANWLCVRASELGAAHTTRVQALDAPARSALRQAVEQAVSDRRVLVFLDEPQPDRARAALNLLRGVQGRVLVLQTSETPADADHQLELEPLPELQMSRMVRDVLGLAGPVAAQVVQRAQGNPLLAVQLVRHAGPNLVSTREGYMLRPGAELALPQGLDRVWRERLEAFLGTRTDAERQALELAAVGGMELVDAAWRQLCARVGLALEPDLLDAMLRAGLAYEHGADWLFVHPLLRDVLQDSPRRARWHGLLAEHVADRGQRGLHLLEAADPAAFDALLVGVREAMKAADYPRAEVLLSARDRAGGHDAPGLTLAARLAGVRGSPQEGVGLAREALELATDLNERTRAWLQGARLLTSTGESEAASDWYDWALKGADRLGEPALSGRVHELHGHYLVEQGQLAEGEASLRQAAVDFTDAGLEEDLSGVHLGLGFIALGRDDGPSAAEHGHVALRYARGLRAENNALALLGDAHRLMGDLAKAREYFERTAERAHKAGLIYGACINELNLALIELEEGKLPEARRRVRRFSPALEARGARILLGVVALVEAVSAAGEGRHTEIPALLDRAEAELLHSGHVNRDVAWLATRLAERALPAEAARASALATWQLEALA